MMPLAGALVCRFPAARITQHTNTRLASEAANAGSLHEPGLGHLLDDLAQARFERRGRAEPQVGLGPAG